MKCIDTFLWPKLIGLSMICCASAACNRSEPSTVTIEQGTTARINKCHVQLHSIYVNPPKYPDPFADIRFACGVPESALNEKNWWGNQTPPLMNTFVVGDCMRLEKTVYCVEQIELGKHVKLKATYEVLDSDLTLMKRSE